MDGMGTYMVINKAGNLLHCKNEERPCNQCCSRKAISITHSKCVFVALGIQPAMRISGIYCHLCPVWLYLIISQTTQFSKKKGY